jgi:hypothetical protein
MIYYINTIEDYYSYKKETVPIYIKSKKHGKIEVPCVNTILVNTSLIKGNIYNPNHVPKDKLLLLKQSIIDNGFCFPIVAIFDEEQNLFIIIDGFHRHLISSNKWLDFDYIPLVTLKHNITKRMIATTQFNKARGVHQVDLDAEIIQKLCQQGLSDEDISIHLGIDIDTVYRYKQLTGIADLFKNVEYSLSWNMEDIN